MKTRLFAMAVVMMLPAAAGAVLVVDQQQLGIETRFQFEIGLTHGYRIAQTVTAGMDGRLAQIQMPVTCSSGTLIVEITPLDGDVPGTTVRSRADVGAALLPVVTPLVFRSFDLDRPVVMSAGERFAIVLRNETGDCHVGMADTLNPYSRGDSFFTFHDPPLWSHTGGFLDPFDTAFKTLIEVGGGGGGRSVLCTVEQIRPPLPFPDFTPVCRCLQDRSLREQRCGFFHPALFLFRRIPQPLPVGQPFTVKWTLVALAPLKGVVEVRDFLPPGFEGLKGPLVFFGDQIPQGASMTLDYKAVAGAKAGELKVQTDLSLPIGDQKVGTGELHTVIEVVPKP